MKVAVAVMIGAVLGLGATVGGVAAYQGNSSGSDLKLYSYSDQ